MAHIYTWLQKYFYKVYSYFKFNLIILEGLSREYKMAGQKTGLSEQRTPPGKKKKKTVSGSKVWLHEKIIELQFASAGRK